MLLTSRIHLPTKQISRSKGRRDVFKMCRQTQVLYQGISANGHGGKTCDDLPGGLNTCMYIYFACTIPGNTSRYEIIWISVGCIISMWMTHETWLSHTLTIVLMLQTWGCVVGLKFKGACSREQWPLVLHDTTQEWLNQSGVFNPAQLHLRNKWKTSSNGRILINSFFKPPPRNTWKVKKTIFHRMKLQWNGMHLSSISMWIHPKSFLSYHPEKFGNIGMWWHVFQGLRSVARDIQHGKEQGKGKK